MPVTQDLREAVVRWLENDADVQNRLGSDGAIVPVAVAADDGSSPQLAIGASLSSSTRRNDMHAVELDARVVVSGTFEWVARTDGAVDDLHRLQDDVTRVLTTGRDGWTADGVSTADEVAPNDEVARYLGVLSCTFQRTSRHPFYAP